jgi:transmembrane sensor
MEALMQADRTSEIDPTAPVTEQASGWWLLLNEGNATDSDHRAFAEWATRSPERVGAYLRAAQMARALRSPRMPWPDTSVDELIRTAVAATDVTRLPSAALDPPPAHRATRFMPRFAIAAGLLAIVVIALGLWFQPRTERFETALGEQHSVVLSDGSLVTLNTASRIELEFDRTERQVTLLAGEALFEVAHDVARPFKVNAGDVTVRAVGTKFNVDRHSQSLRVTVVEGRVEVSAGTAQTPLGPGEQLTLAPDGASKVTRPNVAITMAWMQRQLIFENQPLAEITAQINRYNRKVIEIQSAQLREERVTGVFQSNDPASFVAFLSRIPGVTVEESADRYIVRMRR